MFRCMKSRLEYSATNLGFVTAFSENRNIVLKYTVYIILLYQTFFTYIMTDYKSYTSGRLKVLVGKANYHDVFTKIIYLYNEYVYTTQYNTLALNYKT